MQSKKRSIAFLWHHRANEVVGWRMNFLPDANANFEGLLEVNQEFCILQMAEKASPDAPPNCAVLPYISSRAAYYHSSNTTWLETNRSAR